MQKLLNLLAAFAIFSMGAAQTCEEEFLATWTQENEGYGAADGVCGYDFPYCTPSRYIEGEEDTSEECTACVDKVNAELANHADRFCNPAAHCTPAPLDSCTLFAGRSYPPYEDEFWTSYEHSLEDCVATLKMMVPDAADRENAVASFYWDNDEHASSGEGCNDEDGACWGECYMYTNIDKAEWDAYYDTAESDPRYDSCLFDATYDDEAAINAAEVACEPAKTSSAPTIAASVVGVLVSALAAATFN